MNRAHRFSLALPKPALSARKEVKGGFLAEVSTPHWIPFGKAPMVRVVLRSSSVWMRQGHWSDTWGGAKTKLPPWSGLVGYIPT